MWKFEEKQTEKCQWLHNLRERAEENIQPNKQICWCYRIKAYWTSCATPQCRKYKPLSLAVYEIVLLLCQKIVVSSICIGHFMEWTGLRQNNASRSITFRRHYFARRSIISQMPCTANIAKVCIPAYFWGEPLFWATPVIVFTNRLKLSQLWLCVRFKHKNSCL